MEVTAYTALVPLVMGLAQVYKMSLSGLSKTKQTKLRNLVPSITILLAIGLSLLSYGATGEVAINGIVTGLSAIGLFSGTRTTAVGVKAIVSK